MDQSPLKDIEEVKNKFSIKNKKIISAKKEINRLVFGQDEIIEQN